MGVRRKRTARPVQARIETRSEKPVSGKAFYDYRTRKILSRVERCRELALELRNDPGEPVPRFSSRGGRRKRTRSRPGLARVAGMLSDGIPRLRRLEKTNRGQKHLHLYLPAGVRDGRKPTCLPSGMSRSTPSALLLFSYPSSDPPLLDFSIPGKIPFLIVSSDTVYKPPSASST